MSNLEKLAFMTEKEVNEIASCVGTPVYVYSQAALETQANKVLAFPNAFGLTARYAMKANSNGNILRIFGKKGIFIDASSGYEVMKATSFGIPAVSILLTSQQIPDNLRELLEEGISYTACSLHQLEEYGAMNLLRTVSIRINPGLGSGGTNRTSTGGTSSSFGIWHEQIEEALEIAKKYKLNIKRVHTHIGSGSDPEVWKQAALVSLRNVKRFLDAGHEVHTLNLGGGYKIGRMSYEQSTDLQDCGNAVKDAFIKFHDQTNHKLKLEIEPGTFLVANAGALVSKIIDIKSTPGYDFIVIDSGMNEVTRPSLYGAQHPIVVVPTKDRQRNTKWYIVSGHCCESGDILTVEPGNPEVLKPRELLEAKIGDLVVIGGAGAYCSSMSTANYNSYPRAPEVLLRKDGQYDLIRVRQTLRDMLSCEICRPV